MTAALKGCEGPLIWFEVNMPCACKTGHPAAILECTQCGYIVISGGLNNPEHADTPIMREGLAQ